MVRVVCGLQGETALNACGCQRSPGKVIVVLLLNPFFPDIFIIKHFSAGEPWIDDVGREVRPTAGIDVYFGGDPGRYGDAVNDWDGDESFEGSGYEFRGEFVIHDQGPGMMLGRVNCSAWSEAETGIRRVSLRRCVALVIW